MFVTGWLAVKQPVTKHIFHNVDNILKGDNSKDLCHWGFCENMNHFAALKERRWDKGEKRDLQLNFKLPAWLVSITMNMGCPTTGPVCCGQLADLTSNVQSQLYWIECQVVFKMSADLTSNVQSQPYRTPSCVQNVGRPCFQNSVSNALNGTPSCVQNEGWPSRWFTTNILCFIVAVEILVIKIRCNPKIAGTEIEGNRCDTQNMKHTHTEKNCRWCHHRYKENKNDIKTAVTTMEQF